MSEDLSADLDFSMMVRRGGLEGKDTPNGILTRYKNTSIGNLIKQIEDIEDAGTINLGFMLLKLSENSLQSINKGINKLAKLAKKDGRPHDLTLMFDSEDAGLTIHCTYSNRQTAEASLGVHCMQRKYTQRAYNWFGICIDPDSKQLRFSIALRYKWEKSADLDRLVKNLPKATLRKQFISQRDAGIGFGKAVESHKKKKQHS